MKNNSFLKKEHLKKNKDISEVFDKGFIIRANFFSIFLLRRRSGAGINRAAFVARKRLYSKKAVFRNRIKRLLREAYRKTRHFLPPGYDIVILAKNVTKHTKSVAIERELVYVFEKRAKKNYQILS